MRLRYESERGGEARERCIVEPSCCAVDCAVTSEPGVAMNTNDGVFFFVLLLRDMGVHGLCSQDSGPPAAFMLGGCLGDEGRIQETPITCTRTNLCFSPR
jgi:hypothetical protein